MSKRWVEVPDPERMPPTLGTAWWVLSTAFRCWLLGHSGTEVHPEWEGDQRLRNCYRCGRTWALSAADPEAGG